MTILTFATGKIDAGVIRRQATGQSLARQGGFVDAAGTKSGLKFERLADLQNEPKKSWLVYRLLAASEFSALYGEPSAGKSVAAGDLAMHIAAGLPFMGLAVTPSPVLYFACERRTVMARRFVGLQRRMELPSSTPLLLGSGSLDIRDESAADGFIKAIWEFEDSEGQAVGLVILDTLSRTLAGGDENGPKDMGAAVRNVERIREKTSAAIMAIHHVGASMEAKDRMRGSTLLLGAVDTTALVTGGNGGLTIKLKKSNDQPPGGLEIRAEIASFQTGVDDQGEPVTVPYLREPHGNLRGRFDANAVPLKTLAPSLRAALDLLRNAIEADGIPSDGTPGFPADAPPVSLSQWRDAFYQDDIARDADATPDTRRSRFNRAKTGLEKADRIAVNGDRVWPVT